MKIKYVRVVHVESYGKRDSLAGAEIGRSCELNDYRAVRETKERLESANESAVWPGRAVMRWQVGKMLMKKWHAYNGESKTRDMYGRVSLLMCRGTRGLLVLILIVGWRGRRRDGGGG